MYNGNGDNIPSSSTLNHTGPIRTTYCKDQLPGEASCGYGKYCRYAHNPSEFGTPSLLRPNYKTVLCNNYKTYGWCRHGDTCQFIHDEKEARSVPPRIHDENASEREIPKPTAINSTNNVHPYMGMWAHPASGVNRQMHYYMGSTADGPVRYGRTASPQPCPVTAIPSAWLKDLSDKDATPIIPEESLPETEPETLRPQSLSFETLPTESSGWAPWPPSSPKPENSDESSLGEDDVDDVEDCPISSISPSGKEEYFLPTVYEKHLKNMHAQPKKETDSGFDPLFY